jgi:hypothetical protein
MPGFAKPCDFQDFGETLQGDSSPGAPWRFFYVFHQTGSNSEPIRDPRSFLKKL